MQYTGITPVEKMGAYYVKREDLAYWHSLGYPSGSKVRQYLAMASIWQSWDFIEEDPPTQVAPCIVGCSANSAMQIYVAATAKLLNTKGIIYTASRKERTEATKYAARCGAEIKEVKPGYLSLIRLRAKERAKELGNVVQWNRQAAIEDTIRQCENIPEDVKRIIVPTGSGLTAAGIMAGVSKVRQALSVKMAPFYKAPIIVVIKVSTMANRDTIVDLAWNTEIPLGASIEVIEPTSKYDVPAVAQLPDGTPLDPFYAAKAFPYLKEGDLLWPPGLRPVSSMPKACQEAFKEWKGPKNG